VQVGNGVVRVWRDWLKERANYDGGWNEEGILWMDNKKSVGLRVKVVEKEDGDALPARRPLRNGEDPPVSYMLCYEGMFLREKLGEG